MNDEDEVSYELYFSEDGSERIIKVNGPPMSDVEFITALKAFCSDSEANICDDGLTIAFDLDDNLGKFH